MPTATPHDASAPTSTSDPFLDLTTRQLESELLGLAGHIAAAQCRFLQLLAEFDWRAGWAGPGLRSCAHWLCWRIGMSLRTAAEHVRVAHALAELPKITAAFAEGRISYSKVRAITRITSGNTARERGAVARDEVGASDDLHAGPAGSSRTTEDDDQDATGTPAGCTTATRLPTADPPPQGPTTTDSAGTDSPGASPPGADPADREETLLTLALAGTASHVEAVVRATRRRQADPVGVTARRSLSWRWEEDGSLVLRGRFTPDEGAALIAALEALVPPRGPVQHPVTSSPPDWKQRGAEESPGAVADRVAARRADALLALVNAGATAERGDAPAPTVDRGQARVVVVVDATNGAAAVVGGPEVAASMAARAACDGQAQVLLRDRGSNRLYLGRSRRLASPAQIVALTVRDGGCRFPGCTHRRHLHAHHVRHWFHGGRTDLDNLVLLCGFHHRLIHDAGYQVRSDGDTWIFHRPDGTPVPISETPLTGNTESLIEINTRAKLRITRESLTPTWAGERLDPEPILDRLLPVPTRTAA